MIYGLISHTLLNAISLSQGGLDFVGFLELYQSLICFRSAIGSDFGTRYHYINFSLLPHLLGAQCYFITELISTKGKNSVT